MALRGIDAQVMINKSVEVASEQMKNARLHDANQNHLAHLGRLQEREEQGRSQAVSRTENMAIRDDEEREQEEGKSGKKKQAAAEEVQPGIPDNDLMLPVGRRDEHRIDIQV